jgi:hypothetical protein
MSVRQTLRLELQQIEKMGLPHTCVCLQTCERAGQRPAPQPCGADVFPCIVLNCGRLSQLAKQSQDEGVPAPAALAV